MWGSLAAPCTGEAAHSQDISPQERVAPHAARPRIAAVSRERKMAELFVRDEVAVITGAASGIGRAAATRCAKAGMRILLVDVNETKLVARRDAPAEIVGLSRLYCERADVSDFAAMRALAERVVAEWGAPSLLMNNAAGFVAGGPGGILDPHENWE